MKQQTQIKKANKKIGSHHDEIYRLEMKIEKLRESMKYKMVSKGISSETSQGNLTFCPDLDNSRILRVNINRDWNEIYGIGLRYQSVVRFRNYLNDFLKTRSNIKSEKK